MPTTTSPLAALAAGDAPTASELMQSTLAAVARLLAEHPDLPVPYITIYDHAPAVAELKWYLHINDHGDETVQRETAQTIIRTIGGKWDKDFESYGDAHFQQTRGPLKLEVVTKREAVCTRRVVGTEQVTLPAVEAQPERTVEREVVEWDCEPVLGDRDADVETLAEADRAVTA